MPLYESESLVLKSYNLAEADRIVVFFTRDHGIVRGVAKGAKRMNSRFGSTLEPFSTVNLEYYQKDERELVSIQRVDLITSLFTKAGDPDFLDTFSYIADLLTIFSPPHDADATLYRMTQTCMSTAATERGNMRQMQMYFELWLLRLSGFLPAWTRCSDCSREFDLVESADLLANAHLVCNDCSKSRNSKRVTAALRELFHSVQKLSPNDLSVYSNRKEPLVNELSNILQRVITRVVGREVVLDRSSSMIT